MSSGNNNRRQWGKDQESTSFTNQAATPQSHTLIESHNVVITDWQFNQVRTNVVININQNTSGTPALPSDPPNGTNHINPGPITELNCGRRASQQAEIFYQSQDIPLQKSNDIYERHLILKGRGFPLWIPEPNRRLHISYRRTGIRIGDVGIITHSGAFSFLFNICLPHDDPVNPRMLPEHFAPISPPIGDINESLVFKNDDHLSSASIKRSQTSPDNSGIVFESSASEGAILTMPHGARSEDLGNFARFREYAAANVADWYKFVNGPRGREAKNGDIRLVVGFDKTTSWGIATIANQTVQNNSRLRFGPSEGAGSANTYKWESSDIAEVRVGPGSNHNDGLRRDDDPPDVQLENQCLFVRTLNATLPDAVWADINSSLGFVHVNPRNNRPRYDSDSSRSHLNYSVNGSGYATPDVDVASDDKPVMFISGPLESLTAHPSKVLNDVLLTKNPTAKMVITNDDDWSSVITQYDTLPDPHEVITNILASRNICEENGVIFLQRREIPNETS